MKEDYVRGFPRSWGDFSAKNSRIDWNDAIHRSLIGDVQNLECEQKWSRCVPMTATDGRIGFEARRAAKRCYDICEKQKNAKDILKIIFHECDAYGVNHPDGQDDEEKIKRAVDS